MALQIEESMSQCNIFVCTNSNLKKYISKNSHEIEPEFTHLVRSSRREVFCKKSVLRRLATLSKKRLWHRRLTVNFEKFLRAHFLTERLRWLLLTYSKLIILRRVEYYCTGVRTSLV